MNYEATSCKDKSFLFFKQGSDNFSTLARDFQNWEACEKYEIRHNFWVVVSTFCDIVTPISHAL